MVASVPPSSMQSISSVVMPDADGELSDAEAKGDPPVLDRLPEGQGLADRDRQEHDRRGIRLIERQVPQASA